MVDISTVLKMFQLTQQQPADQQMSMLAMGVEQFGSKFLRINGAQAKLIADFLRNQSNLSDIPGLPEETLKDFQIAFTEAAAQEAPIRVICKHCNTMNTL